MSDGRAPRTFHVGNERERCTICRQTDQTIHAFLKSGDYQALASSFETLRELDPDGAEHLLRWQADAALVAEEWEAAWEFRHLGILESNYRITLEDLNYVRRRCQSESLTAEDLHLIVLSDHGLTAWGVERIEQVNAVVDEYLSEFNGAHSENPILELQDKYTERYPTDEEIADVASECDHEVTVESLRLHRDGEKSMLARYRERERTRASLSGYNQWIDNYHVNPKKWCFQPTKGRFVKLSGGRNELPRLSYERQPKWLTLATEGLCRATFRGAENGLRARMGLPAIGEGWVSETELFKLIEEAFPGVNVVQHARPSWLAPQHLDVFIPKYRIGLEYQGKQHYEPIDFFGGEEAFQKRQERDERKRELCRSNDCMLIEVDPGYDPGRIVEKIREARSGESRT